MSITRRQAEERYGSPSALARILRVQPQTVAGWEMDKPLPTTHQKTLCGWVDPEYWASTRKVICKFYPPFVGEKDFRVVRSFADVA